MGLKIPCQTLQLQDGKLSTDNTSNTCPVPSALTVLRILNKRRLRVNRNWAILCNSVQVLHLVSGQRLTRVSNILRLSFSQPHPRGYASAILYLPWTVRRQIKETPLLLESPSPMGLPWLPGSVHPSVPSLWDRLSSPRPKFCRRL